MDEIGYSGNRYLVGYTAQQVQIMTLKYCGVITFSGELNTLLAGRGYQVFSTVWSGVPYSNRDLKSSRPPLGAIHQQTFPSWIVLK